MTHKPRLWEVRCGREYVRSAVCCAVLKIVVHGGVAWRAFWRVLVWTTSPNRLVVHTHLRCSGLQVVFPWTTNCKNLPQRVFAFSMTARCRDKSGFFCVAECFYCEMLRFPCATQKFAQFFLHRVQSLVWPGTKKTIPFPEQRRNGDPGAKCTFLFPAGNSDVKSPCVSSESAPLVRFKMRSTAHDDLLGNRSTLS